MLCGESLNQKKPNEVEKPGGCPEIIFKMMRSDSVAERPLRKKVILCVFPFSEIDAMQRKGQIKQEGK